MKPYHEIFKWSWHFTAMASYHENWVTDDDDDGNGNKDDVVVFLFCAVPNEKWECGKWSVQNPKNVVLIIIKS